DERTLLRVLLPRYFENPISGIGRREVTEIGKPELGLLWRLLANVRQNCTLAPGPSKDSDWFALQGARPRNEVDHAVAPKELNVIKLFHQSGKQQVKSHADIMVSFDGRID